MTIKVKQIIESTDIEVDMYCSHNRGNHQEEVFEDWSDHSRIVMVDYCDHCDHQMEVA